MSALDKIVLAALGGVGAFFAVAMVAVRDDGTVRWEPRKPEVRWTDANRWERA